MKLALPLGRYCLQVVNPGRPVPFWSILLFRRLSAGHDPLTPKNLSGSTGAGLRHPALRRFLANDEMGVWSVCAPTINFLETQIQLHRPEMILEFGSGISTLCLASFMRDVHGDSQVVRVCSVEQNPAVAQAAAQRLAELNLAHTVRFVNAPLLTQRILDREIQCYSISAGDLNEIARLRPDFVLVDGPAAAAGARFGTLPLIRDAVAPGARVFLDDALRDGELDTAKSWVRLLHMTVEGVLPTRKGLLIGRLPGATT